MSGTPCSTGDARALRIGALGGSAAVAAALVTVALLVVVDRIHWSGVQVPESGALVIFLALHALPALALALLPTTGLLAASGALTRPGRAGVLAAGAAGVPIFALSVGLGRLEHDGIGELPGVLLDGALVSALATGFVLLGAAVGVHRWRRVATGPAPQEPTRG